MAKEKKDEGVGDPIKIFLKEALERQRNEMMDNFALILRQIPRGNASSSNSHFRGVAPFNIQVKFDIPIFKGQIDVDFVDKWLNLLEGYFSVHSFSDKEKITFALLKVDPHVKDYWETYCEKRVEESFLFTIGPFWNSF